jgi:hypothetical protein
MSFCPECKYEYVAGVTECPDCAVPLVDDLDSCAAEPEEPEEGPAGASCWETFDEIEADVACDVLKERGFGCMVSRDSMSLLRVLYGVPEEKPPYHVMVAASEVDKARSVLEEVLPTLDFGLTEVPDSESEKEEQS